MTSQNRRQGAYVYDDSTDAAGAEYEVAKRRNATVYDAVAGTYKSYYLTVSR